MDEKYTYNGLITISTYRRCERKPKQERQEVSLRRPPRGSLVGVATRDMTAMTLSLLATRGPELNRGMCNQLPGDQRAALELLDLKQSWINGSLGCQDWKR
jgi:hypothetical protein